MLIAHRLPAHKLWRIALRLLLAYVLLTAVFISYARDYGSVWLGFYHASMSLWAPALQVEPLTIENQNGQWMFVSVMSNKMPIKFRLQDLPAASEIQVSTVVGNAVQAPILMLTLILAWQTQGWRHRLSALGIALPMLALLAAVDIPWVLVGAAWEAYFYYLEPESRWHVFSIQIMHILNNGGRLALGLAAALVCLYLPLSLKRRRG